MPDVMGKRFARGKTAALHKHADAIFGEKKFDEFLINIGIVATHVEYNRPMVFKRCLNQAHGSAGSFKPGFGCSIADAVISSCAAHPVFKKKQIETLRIDDSFTDRIYKTDFIESDVKQLERIFQLGRKSFEQNEKNIEKLFQAKTSSIAS